MNDIINLEKRDEAINVIVLTSRGLFGNQIIILARGLAGDLNGANEAISFKVV